MRRLFGASDQLVARAVVRGFSLAVALAATGCSSAATSPATPATPATPAAPAPPPTPVALNPAQIAARATPAVVSIRSPKSLGTGFVIRKDGWIATNFHVIVGAPELVVATADKREFAVLEVVAADPVRDLAVIRVDASDLNVVALGDSDAVRAGDSIVAIGHPLGLEDTVSNGLVSAVRVVDPTLTVLQISAPIAPGSSGGPLFSDKGEVIGVATRYSPRGQNLNFGVPVRYLKAILDAPRPVPLAAFAAETTPRGGPGPAPGNGMPTVKREIPHFDPSILAGCADGDLEQTAKLISEAINVGAPVYNEGHFAACYHIYDGAALEVEKHISQACAGPRKALHEGRTKAGKLEDASAQAFAMRDAFDGVMEVIMRRLVAQKIHRDHGTQGPPPSLDPTR